MGRSNLRRDDKRRGSSKGGRSDRSSGSGSYGDRSYGDRSYGSRPSYGRGRGSDSGGFSRPPREMHKAVCAECGKECEVPFKPTEGRPVYCRDCFAKKRGPRY